MAGVLRCISQRHHLGFTRYYWPRGALTYAFVMTGNGLSGLAADFPAQLYSLTYCNLSRLLGISPRFGGGA